MIRQYAAILLVVAVLAVPLTASGQTSRPTDPRDKYVVTLDHSPTGLALTEDAARLIIAHAGANMLSVYDIAQGKVIASVKSRNPGMMCCRGDLVFVGNNGRGTIGVHSRKAGYKLVDELEVPCKVIAGIDARREAAYDGRLLVNCADDYGGRGAGGKIVIVDVNKDEHKVLASSSLSAPAAVFEYSGRFVIASGHGVAGLYHANEYLAGSRQCLSTGMTDIPLVALPGQMWLSRRGLRIGLGSPRSAGWACLYDAGADMLLRLDREGASLIAATRESPFEPLETLRLPQGIVAKFDSYRWHLMPHAVTIGDALHLLTLDDKMRLLHVKLPAVKRPAATTQAATIPAIFTEPAGIGLATPAATIFDAADGQSVMLLRDLELTWLRPSDLSKIRSLTLPALYAKVYERKDHIVALGDSFIDLLDPKDGKLIKRHKLPGEQTLDMACPTKGADVYVSVLRYTDSTGGAERKGVIYHVNEKTGAVTDTKAAGWKLMAGPQSILLTLGPAGFSQSGPVDWWGRARALMPESGDACSYDASGASLTLKKQLTQMSFALTPSMPAAGAGTALATERVKDSDQKCFLIHAPDLSKSTRTKIELHQFARPAVCMYGDILAVAAWGTENLKLFDTQTGKDVTNRLGRAGILTNCFRLLHFSPDGKYLLGIQGEESSFGFIDSSKPPRLVSMPLSPEGAKP